MPTTEFSCRFHDGRLSITATGAITLRDVERLLPHIGSPQGTTQLELHFADAFFSPDALLALAQEVAQATLPVDVFPPAADRLLRELAPLNTPTGKPLDDASLAPKAGWCLVAQDGTIRRADARARRTLAIDAATDPPHWADICPPDRDPVAEALATGLPVRTRWSEGLVVDAIPLPEGAVALALVPADARALAGLARREAIAQMAATAAHDVRNPLAALYAGIQLLQDRLADPGLANPLRMVANEAKRLGRLFDHYFVLNRPTEFRRIALSQVLLACLERCRQDPRAEGVTIDHEAPPPAFTLGDPQKLRHAFWNLLANALDMLAGHGRLTVAAAVDAHRGLIVTRVCDTGPGFPAEVLAAPFALGGAGKESGAGFGLAVAHELIAAHGGRMHLSNMGGATVTVELPLIPDRPQESAARTMW